MITNPPDPVLSRMHDQVVRVYIDARCRVSYSAFFIQGLCQVFGSHRVSFSARHFSDVKRENPPADYERYMCVLIKRRSLPPVRVAIDFHDGRWLSENAYEWCDVYAKVNLDPAMFPPLSHPKIVVTSPNSGYRIWSRNETGFHYWMNLLRCGFMPLCSRTRFRRDYKAQRGRLPLEFYESTSISRKTKEGGDVPYVFYVSTLWRHVNCVERTNPWRKMFMEVCRESPCHFEGGFFADDPTHPQYVEYGDYRLDRKYSLPDYIDKMSRSAIAFNTPAVHDCHGWKLSEYLAMGKAILSTPISNMLPVPLEHGRNVHIVNSESEMREGVLLLLKDPYYRNHLSEGAKAYYRDYATPFASIRLILESDVFQTIV